MYKAVIFDLDGTAIPNKKDGIPSEQVISAVHKIKDRIPVSAATGRGINMCREIIKSLGLKSPCIVNGGTRIIDPITEKVLWEKELDKSQVEAIIEVIKDYEYNVIFSDELEGTLPKDKVVKGGERIVYIEPVTKEDTVIILNELNKIPNIIAHRVMSWTPDHFDIHITHSEATKGHSMKVLLEILKVHKDDVVAIGDSNNDLPLFKLAGYKVAMGNGSEELKEKADFIAPTVDDDGLAVALEKLFYKFMNENKNSLEKNIEEMKEWQEHQYDSGYWLGGKIPPYEFRKSKKLGVLYIIVGIVGLILNLLHFSFMDVGQQTFSAIFILLVFFAGYFNLKGN